MLNPIIGISYSHTVYFKNNSQQCWMRENIQFVKLKLISWEFLFHWKFISQSISKFSALFSICESIKFSIKSLYLKANIKIDLELILNLSRAHLIFSTLLPNFVSLVAMFFFKNNFWANTHKLLPFIIIDCNLQRKSENLKFY